MRLSVFFAGLFLIALCTVAVTSYDAGVIYRDKTIRSIQPSRKLDKMERGYTCPDTGTWYLDCVRAV